MVKRNIGILVSMFREAPHKPLDRLLKPFKDMLTCSPKLCTHFSAQVCTLNSSALAIEPPARIDMCPEALILEVFGFVSETEHVCRVSCLQSCSRSWAMQMHS